MSALDGRWSELFALLGGAGAIGGSMRLFPRFWRGFARILASPILLEIQREMTKAREQQVADLLERIEGLEGDLKRERGRDGSAD